MRAAREVSEGVLDEYAAADPNYAGILSAWRKFRTDSFDWFLTAEQAYAEFAFRP